MSASLLVGAVPSRACFPKESVIPSPLSRTLPRPGVESILASRPSQLRREGYSCPRSKNSRIAASLSPSTDFVPFLHSSAVPSNLTPTVSVEHATHRVILSLADADVASITAEGLPEFDSETAQSLASQMEASDKTTYILVTTMSALAIIGLLVLTGGVVYLAYADWKDKQEVEELQKLATSAGKTKRPEIPKPKESPLGAAKGFGKRSGDK